MYLAQNNRKKSVTFNNNKSHPNQNSNVKLKFKKKLV